MPTVSSVQQYTATLFGGDTSVNVSLGTTTSTRCLIIPNGSTYETASTTWREIFVRHSRTGGSQITVARDPAATGVNGITASGVVIDLDSSAVVSVQTGTVTIASSATSGTATISSVNKNNSVIQWLGTTVSTTTTGANTVFTRVELTNSTTVTAFRGSSNTSTLTVGYVVIEFASGVLASNVQHQSITDTTNATTYNDTIASVSTGNTLLLYNGCTTSSSILNAFSYSLELTSSTNVQRVRTGTTTTSRTTSYCVLEFASGVLASNVQRGVKSLSGATSTTQTISSVGSTLGGIAACGASYDGSSSNDRLTRQELTSPTEITFSKQSSSNTSGNGWQAFEFSSGGTTYNDTISEGITLGESLAAALTANPSLSESVTLTDTNGAAATFVPTLTEAIALGDSLSGGLVLAGMVSEALTLAESLAVTATIRPSLSEALSLLESLSASATFQPSYSEALIPGDSMAVSATLSPSITEALLPGESMSAATTFRPNLSESISLTEQYGTALTAASSIIESITVGDTAAALASFNAAVAEAVSLGDSYSLEALAEAMVNDWLIRARRRGRR